MESFFWYAVMEPHYGKGEEKINTGHLFHAFAGCCWFGGQGGGYNSTAELVLHLCVFSAVGFGALFSIPYPQNCLFLNSYFPNVI